jgi:putative transposase
MNGYLHTCASVMQARTSIMDNRARPHSSLGKKTPNEAYTVMLPTVKLAA